MIRYMLDRAAGSGWTVTVADQDARLAAQKIGGHPQGRPEALDARNDELRSSMIAGSDLVLSLLPADMHALVGRDCIRFGSHLVTASYISPEMQSLNSDAEKANVLLLNELGADPGIDHISAMETLDSIREEGGSMESFRSFCGAIPSPESMNPWGYKFTWSPRNVVLAGSGNPAVFLSGGKMKYIPYQQLFNRIEKISIPGLGEFEAYANRDSLGYQIPYRLENARELLRATLRHPGFCSAWNALVTLGLTNDSFRIRNPKDISWRDFLERFLPEMPGKSIEERLNIHLGSAGGGQVMEKLLWLGIPSDEKTGLKEGTAADFLENLLKKKWEFKKGDRDILVMQHQYKYVVNGKKKEKISSLVIEGKENETAISRTVGIPAAIGARLILEGKIISRGVRLPLLPEFYVPILKELEGLGIAFTHEVRPAN